MRFIRFLVTHENVQLVLGAVIFTALVVLGVYFNWGGSPCDWDMDVWVCH